MFSLLKDNWLNRKRSHISRSGSRFAVDMSSDFLGGATVEPGLDRLIFEVSRSHTIRHPQPVGFLCTSDQVVAETTTFTTKTQETNIHEFSRIRTHSPLNLAVADLRLKPHGIGVGWGLLLLGSITRYNYVQIICTVNISLRHWDEGRRGIRLLTDNRTEEFAWEGLK
jgi:hypothetical protein